MGRVTLLVGCFYVAASGAAFADQAPACNSSDFTGSNGVALAPLASATTRFPDAGVEATAEVGQSMVATARVTTYATSFTLSAPIRYSGDDRTENVDIEIPPHRLAVSSTGAGFVLYDAVSGVAKDRKSGKFAYRKLQIAIKDRPAADRLVWTKGMRVFADDIAPVQGSTQVCESISSGGYRSELVYTGTSKGTVSILYREFKDDLARPAFSQQLTYDLADGDEIGYRGARFKIVKATNVNIRYVVTKPLDGQ